MTTPIAGSGRRGGALAVITPFATVAGAIYYFEHVLKDAHDIPVWVGIVAVGFASIGGLVFALGRIPPSLPPGYATVDPAKLKSQPWASGRWYSVEPDSSIILEYVGDEHAAILQISGLRAGEYYIEIIAFSGAKECFLAKASCGLHGGAISSSAEMWRQRNNRLRVTIRDAEPPVDVEFERRPTPRRGQKRRRRK